MLVVSITASHHGGLGSNLAMGMDVCFRHSHKTCIKTEYADQVIFQNPVSVVKDNRMAVVPKI